MNENLNLVEILKDCPKGFKLYTPLIGEVEFIKIREGTLPVLTLHSSGIYLSFTKEGTYFNFNNMDAECLLFPSAEQRDWSKFNAHWYKNERFDTKTLQPFDRILGRDNSSHVWKCNFKCVGIDYIYCIPYNDDTQASCRYKRRCT